MASAFRSESTVFSGPSETSTTSPPCASLIRSASSTAFRSVGLRAASPERSSRFVAGSIRLWTVASGTCLTQTAIFIGADSIGAETVSEAVPILPRMSARPMPWSAVLAMCALLVVTAFVMATQSVALAADGAFQLVRTLGSEDVYVPLDARVLAAWAHQGLVIAAVRAGVTDTQVLTFLLGVGQIVLPAVAWSLAIALSRIDRLVCATIAMVAALNAGATWFLSVNEVVQAAPLTTLVAVVLWQPRAWRWYHVLVALAASSLLVATYETALLTGAVLAVWALWRATRSTERSERYACLAVAALSLLSVVVAIAGSQVG